MHRQDACALQWRAYAKQGVLLRSIHPRLNGMALDGRVGGEVMVCTYLEWCHLVSFRFELTHSADCQR